MIMANNLLRQFSLNANENDWIAVNSILLSINPCQEARELRLPEYLQVALQPGWQGRYRRWRICPSKIFFRLKTRLFPRRTPVDMDEDFVKQLFI